MHTKHDDPAEKAFSSNSKITVFENSYGEKKE